LALAYPRDGGKPLETKGGLAQRWGDRAVTEITDIDIDSVLDEARRSGTPGLGVRNKRKPSDHRARDLHTALSSFFGWLHKRRPRIVSSNPAAGVLLSFNVTKRERLLTSDEIVCLWRACDKINGQFGAVLKLLLLTGQRLNEIAAMRWDELREDSLHLPGVRTKNKKPHIVPLSPLALQIIAAVPRRIEHCPFVFSTTGRSPISGWSKL
jgi:integrase